MPAERRERRPSGRAGPRGRRPGVAEREPAKAPWAPRCVRLHPRRGRRRGALPCGLEVITSAGGKASPRRRHFRFRARARRRAEPGALRGSGPRAGAAGLRGFTQSRPAPSVNPTRLRLFTVGSGSLSSPRHLPGMRGWGTGRGRWGDRAGKVGRPRAPSPRRLRWPSTEVWAWGCWPFSQAGKLRLSEGPARRRRQGRLPLRRCKVWMARARHVSWVGLPRRRLSFPAPAEKGEDPLCVYCCLPLPLAPLQTMDK